ncbi:SDR family oxidoreductase [Hirschia litorea]|uniref:SDR family oxidoreductase n=1 Tax=Hirschia litorea TaxID=1199156 RepID=A0ABW2IMV8_9PROT
MATSSHPTLVIIGGAKRIGNVCARVFSQQGWSVFLADTDAKALKAIKETLGDKVDTLSPSTITTNIGLNNILSGAMSAFGHVDAVCHIPELPPAKNFGDIKVGEFEEKIIAPARSITAALRIFSDQMIKQMEDMDPAAAKTANPSFVQVFGLGALYGDPGAYSQHVSQAMALAAAKAATIDLAAQRIRTNAIIAVRPRAENEEPWLKERTPLGRHSFAEEISQAVAFLTSDGAANMTGQSIILDGGRSTLNGVCNLKDEEES